jgi:two-component system sensor histidine kinase DegS
VNALVKQCQLELVTGKSRARFGVAVALTLVTAFTYYFCWYQGYEWFWWFSVWEFHNALIGSLLFIPFLYAAITLGLRGAVVIWLLSLMLILPHILIFSFSIVYVVRNVAFALVPLAIATSIGMEITWRNKQRQIAADREAERQQYVEQILKIQEDERRRVAQELHDGVIQQLVVIANKAQEAINHDNNENGEKGNNIRYVRDSAIGLTEDLRRISLDLRPSILDNLGLVPAVRWLTEKVAGESEIKTKLSVDGGIRKLSSETELMIFRIIQEALNNVQRHSNATEAMLNLIYDLQVFKIIIEDNGVGFYLGRTSSSTTKKTRLGIMGMKQRVQSLGGDFEINSNPGKGTRISISIPE